MTEWLHFHFSLSCIGEGNGNPLQCSCLENPRGRGAWWAAVYGVTQSRTWLKWLSSSSSRTKSKSLNGAGIFTKECNNSGVEMSVRNKEAPPAQELKLSKFSLRKLYTKLYFQERTSILQNGNRIQPTLSICRPTNHGLIPGSWTLGCEMCGFLELACGASPPSIRDLNIQGFWYPWRSWH